MGSILVKLIFVAEEQKNLLRVVEIHLEVHKVIKELRKTIEYDVLSKWLRDFESLLTRRCCFFLFILLREETLEFTKLSEETKATSNRR